MLRSILCGSFVALSFVVLGCSSEPNLPADAEDHHSHEGHTTHEETDVDEAFAKLDPKDREAALAQKICPVSDQALGSMGKPIKVTVDGQDIFVCCAGCVEELKNNFAEYKSKLTH
jgi:hypothetical protein